MTYYSLLLKISQNVSHSTNNACENFFKKRKGVSRDFLDSLVVKNPPASARDTNKDLLYSTENSTQCYVEAWMGGRLGENAYVYMYD